MAWGARDFHSGSDWNVTVKDGTPSGFWERAPRLRDRSMAQSISKQSPWRYT